MKKTGLILIFLFIISSIHALDFDGDDNSSILFKKFYSSGLSYSSFRLGMEGYKRICDSLNYSYRYLCIADFIKPSTEKRLFVFDMKDSSLFFIEYVTHGKKSGELYAEQFSNVIHSNKSSLGFYLISESYEGKHGLSIRLDGLDYGFNDKARDRNIVMHAASYADSTIITSCGRLGRSLGCPALPKQGFEKIANCGLMDKK